MPFVIIYLKKEIATLDKSKIQQYWQNFLLNTNRSPSEKYSSVFYFGSNKNSANHLLKLVLDGKKKATASSFESFALENEPIPQVGDFSVILDGDEVPRCVIQTTDILKMKFKDMCYDICKREGEDDSLASWQQNHIDFFSCDGKKLGYAFSWDMDIIFEDFEVIYQSQ